MDKEVVREKFNALTQMQAREILKAAEGKAIARLEGMCAFCSDTESTSVLSEVYRCPSCWTCFLGVYPVVVVGERSRDRQITPEYMERLESKILRKKKLVAG